MKLRYRKLVVMIGMCTIGIGLVAFSAVTPSKKNTTPVESIKSTLAENKEESDTADADISGSDMKAASIMPTATPTPTEAPKKTEKEIIREKAGTLEKNAYKDVNKLIKNYLNAKLSKKIDNFKSLVNNVDYIDLTDIKRKTKYIEKYKNVVCYTKKGPEEGSYIVYAYHEVKFKGIDTLAPAMNQFYVKTDKDGKPYIYLGEIDSDTEKYIDVVKESSDVMKLINNVNDKLQTAVKNDKALYEFYVKLEESAKKVSTND